MQRYDGPKYSGSDESLVHWPRAVFRPSSKCGGGAQSQHQRHSQTTRTVVWQEPDPNWLVTVIVKVVVATGATTTSPWGSETSPIPLSIDADSALAEIYISVVEFPEVTEIGSADRSQTGGGADFDTPTALIAGASMGSNLTVSPSATVEPLTS